MGGNQVEDCDDWQLTVPLSCVTTMVLVGRTGNGKSQTRNSILGRNAFKSLSSSWGVTATCDLQQAFMKDGRLVRVVGTPGLFDLAVSTDFLGKEIVKCIDLAKNGVHGVLLVLSIRNRFTSEEAAALKSLQMLFGDKIVNYMVIVFTGGDELGYHKQTLKGYLDECPQELQALLIQCNRRTVLFSNRTKSETEKARQRNELLKQVDIILAENGGQPYSNELFHESQVRSEKFSNQKERIDNLTGYSNEELQSLQLEMKKAYAEQLKQLSEMARSEKLFNQKEHIGTLTGNFIPVQFLLLEMEKAHAERLKQLTKMVEEKLQISTEKLEQQLASERSAWEQADEEIHRLKEKLEQANKETENLKNQMNKCVFL